MTYLRPHSRTGFERFRFVFVLIIIAAIALTGTAYFMPHFFPGLFSAIARPFWRTEFAIRSGALDAPSSLIALNEELRRELEAVKVRLDDISYIENENMELRALLGYATSTEYILAAVLKRPPYGPYDELIIDIGRDRNISSSTIVHAQGGIPIGQVAEVLGQTSKVVLFSSPGQRHEAMVGDSHIPAMILGRGGGQYEAELPRGVTISEGDFVESSVLGEIPLGKVIAVISDPTQPFQKILVAPPVNLYQIRWVLVEKRNASI